MLQCSVKVNMAFEIGPVRLIKEACIFCVCKSYGFLVPFRVQESLFLFWVMAKSVLSGTDEK